MGFNARDGVGRLDARCRLIFLLRSHSAVLNDINGGEQGETGTRHPGLTGFLVGDPAITGPAHPRPLGEQC